VGLLRPFDRIFTIERINLHLNVKFMWEPRSTSLHKAPLKVRLHFLF
jgi:hypothetical protein